MQPIDIRPDHLRLVLDILQQHVPMAEVWAFGSRAKWLARDTSDLDLCIRDAIPLSFEQMGLLREAFEESNLPYKVDVVDWATISASFRKVVERDKVVVQKAKTGRVMAGEWRHATLGKFVSLQRGHDLTEPERKPGAVPVMGSAGQNGFHATALAKGPGIVIGRSGASFGQVHYCPVDYWPHNTTLYVTDFHGNDPRFAYYFLKSINFARYNSGSAQPSLNRNFIYPIEVNVPQINEQHAIAHILGTLDDKIELNRRMNETLEAIARAIFKSWFVDFDPVRAKASGEAPESICRRLGLTPDLLALFPDRLVDSELGEIPEGWDVGAFHNCCDRIESGGTPSRSVTEYWNGTIPWLTSGEVRDVIVLDTKEKITDAGLNASSAKVWPKGATVVAMYGATAGQICLLAGEMTANQACCALIPRPEFTSFVFLAARGSIAQLADKASGSAQQNLNKSLVANHQLIVPALHVVDAFEHLVSHLIEKWISNQREGVTLATLRDALLPKLLSGELRVPETESSLEAMT